MNANQTNSIGISKWADGAELFKMWESGDGENKMVGWQTADGLRAIETNGDPVFEGAEGFEAAWEANA